jgi:hypothetical protein
MLVSVGLLGSYACVNDVNQICTPWLLRLLSTVVRVRQRGLEGDRQTGSRDEGRQRMEAEMVGDGA